MADFQRRVVKTERVEYVLPSPTNAGEYAKAYHAACADARSRGVDTGFDDWLQVAARDDEVVLSFTVPG